MHVMSPTIVIESESPAIYGRRTSVRWTAAGFEIHGDNSVGHGGEGSGPDGFDLLGAALGHCLLTTVIATAQREEIALQSARALVATKSKLQGSDRAPYLSDFQVDIYLEGELSERQRAQLERATAALCGVRETLMRAPRIVERVHIGPLPELAPDSD